MTWVFITPDFGDESTTHFVPRLACEEHLVAALEAGWRASASGPGSKLVAFKVEPRTSCWLDLGGIAMIDRKLYTLPPIDGLTLTVPAGHVEGYLSGMRERKPEDVGGLSYYFIGSFHIAVVLSPAQYDVLEAMLSAILPEANAVATAENKAFNDRMVGSHPSVKISKRPVGPMEDA